MKISELKEFLNTLPEELDSFDVVNGEYGYLPEEDGEEKLHYRVDKPIQFIAADEKSKEIVFCHQTEDEIKEINYEKK